MSKVKEVEEVKVEETMEVAEAVEETTAVAEVEKKNFLQKVGDKLASVDKEALGKKAVKGLKVVGFGIVAGVVGYVFGKNHIDSANGEIIDCEDFEVLDCEDCGIASDDVE